MPSGPLVGQDRSLASSSAETATVITYTDEGFSPKQTNVVSGQAVQVVNNSRVSLEFASGNHPDHSLNPELNLSSIEPGKNANFRVTTTGVWMFHNHFAHHHIGMLTVSNNPR